MRGGGGASGNIGGGGILAGNAESRIRQQQQKDQHHYFQQHHFFDTNAYFPDGGFFKELFAKDNRFLRLRLCAIWGFMSLILGYFILCWNFDFSSGKAFFIAATTMTTIGYGPLFESNRHHNFLSYFSLVHVMPFLFLEVLVTNDMCESFADQVKSNISIRCHKGSNAHGAFKAELRMAVASCLLLLTVLLLSGAVVYKYFADQDEWSEGIFYAITSATSIGYGSFDVDNDNGYYGIGVYAILCNLSVTGIIFPQLASFWVLAGENIEQAKHLQREEYAASAAAPAMETTYKKSKIGGSTSKTRNTVNSSGGAASMKSVGV
jgi:predicted permease